MGIWTHDHWIPFRCSNQLSYHAISLTCTQTNLCRAAPIPLFAQCQILFWQLPSSVGPSVVKKTDKGCILHWEFLWSSYRELVLVGFEPTTNDFRSDSLPQWAIRPSVELALRASFEKVLQFSHFFRVRFYFEYCLSRNFVEVITWV